MCGIVGIINHSKNKFVDSNVLHRMADLIQHRGPDDNGFYVKNNIGLGSRRLSIIDISTGHQPISNEDRTIWIVFNGEIYNFLKLREELVHRGHKFITDSDTESIVHGYEEFGEEIFQKLNGMFAIAIWDENKQKLLLARDRAGEKPLHYFNNSNTFLFGSEIKSLLLHPEISKEINWNAFDEFFSFGYISAPDSIYKNIKKLKQAHYLILQNGVVTEKPYWKIDLNNKNIYTYQEAQEHCFKLLEDSVKIRLMSDVPLGAFLSGGIDSSIIVALMAKNSSKPVKTFSIGFDYSDFDETKYAKIIADKYTTEHTELIVTPNYSALIESILSNFDEPFGDSSALPTYLVSKLTREYVKVALSGDGGDELFGGYNSYQEMIKLKSKINLVPSSLKKIASHYYKYFDSSTKHGKKLRLLGMNDIERFLWSSTHFTEDERTVLYSPEIKERINNSNKAIFKKSVDFIYQNLDINRLMQYIDFNYYLPDDVLVKVDRSSMLASLESRAPFLDHRLIEFAFSLPSEWKMKAGKTKIILKDAFKQLLPNEILSRRKMGFGIPVKKWFTDELYGFCQDYLLNDKMRSYFDLKIIRKYLEEHKSGKFDHSYKLWLLLSFSIWKTRNN